MSESSPQGESVQCPQGHDFESEKKPSIISATAISKLQLDHSFRNSLYSLLKQESPYDEIIVELESGRTNVQKNDEVYKKMNGTLGIHLNRQDAELDYWRIVVPDDVEVRNMVVQELHSTPYSAHPGIQRTVGKIRRSFYWKGMSGHIRQFVENCPVCQMEKLTTH